MQLTKSFLAVAALCSTAFAKAIPAGGNKPTGGPASAFVSIYPSYKCTAPNAPPPTDGTAGVPQQVSVTENQCVIVDIPFGGAFTAKLTATPKTGTTACYIQIFSQQGCGLTLQNQYHGFPFDGLTTTNTVGCASPPVTGYGALEIVCA
ncbi:hypothetical protein E8E13_009423 [Curvularia kusanoi]|uniref:Hypersensitive response-inducing protein n=1 Tax=Curvularia kusanoi TaxID=90978 RepID=A0A9P4TFV3_CURKU|nr:hypothetical protein E8E13_009423 [Curvularia kusanoi]